jgi:energy-coupling factor transport system ATP-binding protein
MIDLENVSYTYPHTMEAALQNLTLFLPKGKCIMVTGPSGAGKTTLCLAAAGIIHHEYGGKKEGTITVEGKNVSAYTGLSDIAQKIGIVFDDPEAQMIFTTVEEEILSALEHRGLEVQVIEDRLASIMQVTHLSELRNRSPHKLSGGQKQRVALAATLALGNDIVILDEPTSELDEHATERIVSILQNLKSQGKTILLVEHKFSHFREIIDTLVIMEQGKISAMGTPSDLFADERLRKIVLPDFSGIREIKSGSGTTPSFPIGARDPIISVQDLSYSYGDILAIDSLNLSIYPGEFIAIVGENGSGKTTLVKHFNGLLTPLRGNVFVTGKNTRQFAISDLARDVGLVFQNPDHMFFADTVREEVEFGLRNIGIPAGDQAINNALGDVGLSHTKELYPRWLSRGERQRLAIACVIAMRPPAIVLDEPTTGLDGNEARLVMEILKRLQQAGHTIIVITHNREIAQYCADRVILMERGKIISDSAGGGRLDG